MSPNVSDSAAGRPFVTLRSAMHRTTGSRIRWLLTLGFWGALGCDEQPPHANPEPKPQPVIETPAPRPAVAPDPLAGLVVDDMGPLIKGERMELSAQDGALKLKAAIAKLPVRSQVVPLEALRNARSQDVEAVVSAFGAAGAAEVLVKTPGRDGNVAALKVLPEVGLSVQVPDCAAVAIIRKDSTSAVWQKKGGTAAKFRKGLAGPDLSMTVSGLADRANSCLSPIWFLAGESGVTWGLVWDLGERAAKSTDPAIKPTQIGLLHEAPVAGRPVILSSESKQAPSSG